jgi:hypothetical protein
MGIGIADEFSSLFGGSIWRHGVIDIIAFRKRTSRSLAINGRRRPKYEVPDVKFTATLQQVKRALNVDFTVQEWLFDRGPDPGTCCKVDNDIKRLCLEEMS